MNGQERKPLVLIVDDEKVWREGVIPKALESVGVQILKAGNVKQALLLASQHDPEGDDPIDLVILDMRMPLDEDSVELIQEAGIHFLRSYRLTSCPVIVFTAYGSYSNCVAAARAGATAYISKDVEEQAPGPRQDPIDLLIEAVTENLGLQGQGPPSTTPSEEWFERNSRWLNSEFADEWVTLVDESILEGVEAPTGAHVGSKEGVVVLGSPSYEKARAYIIGLPQLIRQLPPLVFVPGGKDEELDRKGR